MSNRFPRLLTEPLVQFLIIGALIYVAYAVFGESEEDFRDTTIYVDSSRIDAFISGWESRWNRPPTRQELNGLIQSYIREDVLYRQAVIMGLNEDDPVTRRRMAQKLEFLTSDLANMAQPAEGALEAFFEENKAAYQVPDRLTFNQVFFNPDARQNSTLSDAAEALKTLESAGPPGEFSNQAGDPFMLQTAYRSVTEAEISRQMGSDFATAVMQLDAGRWHGPVLSGYGVHLVYVYEHETPPPARFEDVKESVMTDWQFEQREKFNADFLTNLKERYEIVIDEIPAERILQVPADSATASQADGESLSR